MDKVSVTKTQASSNKILHTKKSNKKQYVPGETLFFLERFCWVK